MFDISILIAIIVSSILSSVTVLLTRRRKFVGSLIVSSSKNSDDIYLNLKIDDIEKLKKCKIAEFEIVHHTQK